MYGEFLFVAMFIYTLFYVGKAEGNGYNNNLINISMEKSLKKENSSNGIEGKELLFIPKLMEQQIIKRNETNIPLYLNVIINLNFPDENYAKSKLRKKHYSRTRRNLKKENTQLSTTKEINLNIERQPDKTVNLGNIFENIKLRTELQRRKRNIEYQNINETKISRQNITQDKHNKIENIMGDDFPKMTILNEDKEVDVTKWLKNWKDILAVNPFLSTDKPTKPEVEFIDEWKYSYRVTFYEVYNVSNFLCSGILMSPQWVLTSIFCKLGDEVTLLIGVHTLPKNISDHNRYSVLKKVQSFGENLELVQTDRPVQWSFKAPDIRGLNIEEMEVLVHEGKCSVLSWMPVDVDRGIFELRQYPRLMLRTSNRQSLKKNSVQVSPSQPYSPSKKDIGSPVLCDGIITGVILNVEEDTMNVKMLCPILDWISFFTRDGSYFEVTARKFTPKNEGKRLKPRKGYLIYILVLCLAWMTERCTI